MLPPIAVRPYVFAVAGRPELQLNPEVAAALWVPLDHLLHPETCHTVQLDIRGESREFPAFRLDDAMVWGMTERILSTLFDQLDPLAGTGCPFLTLDLAHHRFRQA